MSDPLEPTLRYVLVRVFLPGVGSAVEVYDRLSARDREAWSLNEGLYRTQVVASVGTPETALLVQEALGGLPPP